MDQLATAPYDVEAIRRDFPILSREVYGKPLVYLDNGASAQKPQAVIDAISHAYANEYANVHRGLHFLSNAATEAYEKARETVRALPQRRHRSTRSSSPSPTTEAINLVAYGCGMPNIGEGDEIVLSIMEHHSNIVPWHFLRERQGAKLVWVPVDDDGAFHIEEFEKRLTDADQARRHHAYVERARHRHADQGDRAASPMRAASRCWSTAARARCTCRSTCRISTAISTSSPATSSTARPASACSTARRTCWSACGPSMGGGEMIVEVTEDIVTYNDPPHRFEAGTPPIVQAIGLGAALDYMESIGRDAHRRARGRPADYAHERLSRDQLAAHLRRRAGQGRDRLLRAAGHPRP